MGGGCQGDTSRRLKGGATQETGSMIIKHVKNPKPSISVHHLYLGNSSSFGSCLFVSWGRGKLRCGFCGMCAHVFGHTCAA